MSSTAELNEQLLEAADGQSDPPWPLLITLRCGYDDGRCQGLLPFHIYQTPQGAFLYGHRAGTAHPGVAQESMMENKARTGQRAKPQISADAFGELLAVREQGRLLPTPVRGFQTSCVADLGHVHDIDPDELRGLLQTKRLPWTEVMPPPR